MFYNFLLVCGARTVDGHRLEGYSFRWGLLLVARCSPSRVWIQECEFAKREKTTSGGPRSLKQGETPLAPFKAAGGADGAERTWAQKGKCIQTCLAPVENISLHSVACVLQL